MLCPSCGAVRPEDANYCPRCGTRLVEGAPSPVARALEQARALIEAAQVTAIGAGRDLDGMLDGLAERAKRLLAADDATLHLAVPGKTELVRRDRSRLLADEAGGEVGSSYVPNAFAQEAISLRRPRFAADYQHDSRIRGGDRGRFPTVVASLVAPLFADDELIGLLGVVWMRPVELGPEDLEVAQVLARHAALAVRTVRAIEAEREARQRAGELVETAQRVRARAEANEARLATIVEHLPCGVLILDAVGKVIMINEAGRRIAGQAPSGLEPLADQQETYQVRDPRTGRPFERGETAIERALGGELVAAQEVLFRRPGEEQDLRLQISAAPLSDRAGGIRGAVVVYTDVTELHQAVGARARLDGAVKTARLITHELNNKLTAVVANADLLLGMLDGEAVQFAHEIVQGAEEAAAIVARLNQIVRVEEADVGLGVPVLDLEASTRNGLRVES